METKFDAARFQGTLLKIERSVAHWTNLTQIPAIERDIVLAQLRDLYEQITATPEIVGSCQEAPSISSLGSYETTRETEHKIRSEVTPNPLQNTEFEQHTEPEMIEFHSSLESPLTANSKDPESLQTIESETIALDSDTFLVQTEPETQATPLLATPHSQAAFDFQILNSLYGDDEPETNSQPNSEKSTETQTEPETKSDAKLETAAKIEPTSQPETNTEIEFNLEIESKTNFGKEAQLETDFETATEGTDQHLNFPSGTTEIGSETTFRRVLGEVLNSNGNEPLNATIGNQNSHHDLASKISTEATTSLRQCIGVNDRFQMIRELFDGDTTRFEEGIKTLDQFTDLDECFIYIQENYTWNPNGKATKMLVEMLSRKFS